MLEALPEGRIVVVEPRRLAAQQVAWRMAQLLEEQVGQTVGYQIRFERRVSAATRIEVVTEGVMARRLIRNPMLEGIHCIVFDEFTVLCTYIDTNGRQLFDAIYQNTMPYKDGYAPVYRYDRWGIIDRDGKEMLPNIYEHLSTADHGTFFAGDEYGMALFDYTFKPLTPFHYQPITTVSDRRIGVLRNDKYGFLDLRGKEAIPCIYDEIGRFHLGRAMVRLGDRYGIIDTTGTLVLPLQYQNSKKSAHLYTYHDSLALVEQNGHFGYVNLQGQLTIPFHFTAAFPFHEGLAPVQHNGRWGYIDTHGDIYLPFIFDIASPFEYGRAEIIYNGDIRYIDRSGRCVKNCGGIIAFRDINEK